MQFNLEKVRANVRDAETADLLDRATVWRYGMESEALDVIEAELRRRGIGPAELEAHARERVQTVVTATDGSAAVCHCCHAPAVERRWKWWRYWGLLPLFPTRVYVCEQHRPRGRTIAGGPVGDGTATEPAPSPRPPA
jgi:hypothetical protein